MWEFSKNRHRWHMMTLCLYFPAHNTTLILGHQSQTALGFSAFGSSLTSVIRLNAVYNVYSTIYSVLETTRCFHFHPRNLYNTWVAVSSVWFRLLPNLAPSWPSSRKSALIGDRALQSAVRGGITDGRMVLYDHPRPVRHTGALYHITVTLRSCACYGTPQEVGRAHQCRVWKLGMVLSDVFSGCHSKSVNSKSAISRASLIMFECSTRSSVSVGAAFRRSISTLQKQDEWTS